MACAVNLMRSYHPHIQERRNRLFTYAAVVLLANLASTANASVSGMPTGVSVHTNSSTSESPRPAIVVPDAAVMENFSGCVGPTAASLSEALSEFALTGTNHFLPPQSPSRSERDSRVIRELPPAPGSATVVLSGLITLAAFGAMRSARDIHLAALPGWYHTGAPDQIGHTVVFDPTYDSLQLCWAEPPPLNPQAIFPAHHRDLLSPWASNSTPRAAAPRGPPHQV